MIAWPSSTYILLIVLERGHEDSELSRVITHHQGVPRRGVEHETPNPRLQIGNFRLQIVTGFLV